MEMGRDAEDIILQYTPKAISSCIFEDIHLVPSAGTDQASGLQTNLELLDVRDEVPLVQICSVDAISGTCADGSPDTKKSLDVESTGDDGRSPSGPPPLYTNPVDKDVYYCSWSPTLDLLYRPGHYDLLYSYGQNGRAELSQDIPGQLKVRYSVPILTKVNKDGVGSDVSIPVHFQLDSSLSLPPVPRVPSPVQTSHSLQAPSSSTCLPPIREVISKLASTASNILKGSVAMIAGPKSTEWIDTKCGHQAISPDNRHSNASMNNHTLESSDTDMAVTMSSFEMLGFELGKRLKGLRILDIHFV